jgi:hypothetical protein
MTIAVGFKCVDGVVVAADSLYTEGTAKLYGQKIFPIPSNGRYGLLIAGSGGGPSLKGIVREIKKRLKRCVGPGDFADIQEILEHALRANCLKHFDAAPKDRLDDLEVQLLIGVWLPGRGTRLFETFRTDALEVADHRCIGCGSSLAAYLNDVFFPPGNRPSVRLAEPLAAYIVGRSKYYVQFCGGHTFVRALLADGTDERVWNEEIRESEEYCESFFRNIALIRGFVGDMQAGVSSDVECLVKSLRDQVLEFCAKQKAHRDKLAEIRRRYAAVKTNSAAVSATSSRHDHT